MLAGDGDGCYSYGGDEVASFFILHCNLDFAIGSHPFDDVVFPAFFHSPHYFSTETMS
jgi:hypothetical protein